MAPKYIIQAPRYRATSDYCKTLNDHDPLSRPRELHLFCRSCTKAFNESSLLHGSIFQFVKRKEEHKLYGSLSDFRAAVELGCHFCTLMWHKMSENGTRIVEPDDGNTAIERLGPPHVRVMLKKRSWTEDLAMKVEHENLYCFESLAHIEPDDNYSPHVSYSQPHTSSFEHTTLAKSWLADCLMYHSSCRSPKPGFRPRRLLNVGRKPNSPVILFEPDIRAIDISYITLSHRWGGGSSIPTLTSKTIKDFKQLIPWDILPKSFQDAIIITRSLEQTYLWIDSLCIIQDSAEDWFQEAAQMASIYECSVSTISASAAENATVGCFVQRDPLKFADCRVSGTNNDGIFALADTNGGFDELIKTSPLSSRAWIMQERMLSTRILDFGNGLFWSCRRGFASEARPEGWTGVKLNSFSQTIFGPSANRDQQKDLETDTAQRAMKNQLGGDFSQFSRMDIVTVLGSSPSHWSEGMAPLFHSLWSSVVRDYSKRDLTVGSDKLIALAGIVNRLQEVTGFQYLAGLWHQTLPYSLAWYSRTDTEKLRGRPLSYRAPTWSWASIDGEIAFRSSQTFMSRDIANLTCRIDAIEVTPTQPTDRQKTGQVSDALLKVTGYLKKIECFLGGPESIQSGTGVWSHKLHHGALRQGYEVHYRGTYLLGYCYPDIPLTEDMETYLFPFRETVQQALVFREDSTMVIGSQSSKRQVDCLVLIPREYFYERVGLFSFPEEESGGTASQWFDGFQEKQISIR